LSKDKREISIKRAEELKEKIADYMDARKKIKTGFDEDVKKRYEKQKKKILAFFNAEEKDWQDWHWQVRRRINEISVLKEFINLDEDEIRAIEEVGQRFRWAVSPYYLSLIDTDNKQDPLYLQSIPTFYELKDSIGEDDPMKEEYTSPAPAITRRYPDRLIINVTNQCGTYCRHCQRRRNIGEIDRTTPKEQIKDALQYIREHEEIRDVLLTGGDALMLNDRYLDEILTELDNIPHVEIKRLGTRTPVTLPQRITPELCAMLEKHHPLYVNVQFNHPQEITEESAKACDLLSKAGIPLGNQAVLLRGINNDVNVMKKLNHELLKIRVRPYYIFHAKHVRGTVHFNTKIEEGMAIIEKMRGYTSGLAIPTFIVNAPGGYGKVPILPEYLVSMGPDYVYLRTWENKIVEYKNIGGEVVEEKDNEQ